MRKKSSKAGTTTTAHETWRARCEDDYLVRRRCLLGPPVTGEKSPDPFFLRLPPLSFRARRQEEITTKRALLLFLLPEARSCASCESTPLLTFLKSERSFSSGQFITTPRQLAGTSWIAMPSEYAPSVVGGQSPQVHSLNRHRHSSSSKCIVCLCLKQRCGAPLSPFKTYLCRNLNQKSAHCWPVAPSVSDTNTASSPLRRCADLHTEQQLGERCCLQEPVATGGTFRGTFQVSHEHFLDPIWSWH